MTVSGSPSATRYTPDGSDPTSTLPLYLAPVTVSTDLTLKKRGFPANCWSASPTSSTAYTLDYGVLDAPVASPAGGTYGSGQVVTLTAGPGTTIRYTLNGPGGRVDTPLALGTRIELIGQACLHTNPEDHLD